MPKLGMQEVRRGQVIKATERCIIEKGISNFSVKDIAAEANVSTGIIYHYFKNKEDLLLQVIKNSFYKSHEKVMETVEPLDSYDKKLNKHIENINAVPKDNPDFYTILLNYLGEAKHNPEIKKIINKFFKNLRNYISAYMNEGIDNEKVDAEKVKYLPAIVIGLGIGLGIQWTMDDNFFNIEEMDCVFKEVINSYIDE